MVDLEVQFAEEMKKLFISWDTGDKDEIDEQFSLTSKRIIRKIKQYVNQGGV